MDEAFSESGTAAIPVTLVEKSRLDAVKESLAPGARVWVETNGFLASPGQLLVIPTADGRVEGALVGIEAVDDPFALAGAATKLPAGDYRIADPLPSEAASRIALGWGMSHYRFERYKTRPAPKARLVWPEGVDRARVEAELRGITLVRDLVNTPANDLGPAALTEAAELLAKREGGTCKVTVGDDLIAANFPAVHAVGKAAHEPPRVVDISWGGETDPKVTLVGKGITFDTGGLDLKTGNYMALMKKDMGGAAHALALGQMIMELGLPVRLRILLAIAENAIGPGANRPSDVIKTRLGLTVEIGDTDAEGRLVLADMLTLASEEQPAVILDFATLTGAARVALGPDLPALFATDALATEILAGADAAADPVWRLPLWQPYKKDLESKVADLNNIAGNSFAGAIYAALFLQSFVKPGLEWAHFDLYAWNASARPGRPLGGEAFAIRGLYRMLAARYAK